MLKKDMDVLFSHKSDEWSTPPHIFDKLNQKYNFPADYLAQEVQFQEELDPPNAPKQAESKMDFLFYQKLLFFQLEFPFLPHQLL